MAGTFSGLTSNKTRGYFIIFILLGLVMALSSILWEDAVPVLPYGWALCRKLLDHLAIAFFSIGLIAIVIEFRGWQEYFQRRIAETILQQAYLRTLDRNQLIALQTNRLKAFFNVDDLDRKGSFLEYFHARLHEYIASPYREDVDYQFVFSDPEGSSEYWEVDEKSFYKCRAVGTVIQDYVQWTSEPSPNVECHAVIFTIVFPRNVSAANEFKKKYPTIHDSRLTLSSEDLYKNQATHGDQPDRIISRISTDGYVGYRVRLDEYRQIDGLEIKIHARYRMRKGIPFAWAMTHPTRRFSVTLTLNCPRGYRIIVNRFGFESESVDEHDDEPNIYNLRYSSWLLPDSGININIAEDSPTNVPALLQQRSQTA